MLRCRGKCRHVAYVHEAEMAKWLRLDARVTQISSSSNDSWRPSRISRSFTRQQPPHTACRLLRQSQRILSNDASPVRPSTNGSAVPYPAGHSCSILSLRITWTWTPKGSPTDYPHVYLIRARTELHVPVILTVPPATRQGRPLAGKNSEHRELRPPGLPFSRPPLFLKIMRFLRLGRVLRSLSFR